MLLKGYNTAIECLNTFFGIASVSELEDTEEVSLFADTLEDINDKGHWSWLDDSGVTHYWLVKKEGTSSLKILKEMVEVNENKSNSNNLMFDFLLVKAHQTLSSALPM